MQLGGADIVNPDTTRKPTLDIHNLSGFPSKLGQDLNLRYMRGDAKTWKTEIAESVKATAK
jgi:hypothetical protein